MSRTLRSGTRKDYKQMASGEDGEFELDEVENSASDHDVQESGDAAEENLSASGEESDEEVSEEELVELEKKLKERLRLREKLEKKEKLRQLTKEIEKVDKRSKKRSKPKKGKKNHQITSASLRSMRDVQEEVEKLMNKHLKQGMKKQGRKSKSKWVFSSSSSSDNSEGSSSESETSCCSESSGSSIESDNIKKKSRNCSDSKRKSRDRRKKEDRQKKRSGKDKKMTSHVKYPQEWPHSNLSLHFVSNSKKYEDLSLGEFCAGYATILEGIKSKKLQRYRIQHLKELMYLATRYRWDCVLNFHAACVLEIERGHAKWGDSFQNLQITTLAGGFLQSGNDNGSAQRRSAKTGIDGPVTFCRNYQRGTCEEEKDHLGDFFGNQRYLRHICGNCWVHLKKKAPHPETAEECPFKT